MTPLTISAEYIRAAYVYDPETGIFTRRVDAGSRWKAGSVAGRLHPNGYRYIAIGHQAFLAHRLAWLYMTGSMPSGDIDHIDGNGSNNAWANLRDVTTTINCQNQRKPRGQTYSGILGVYPKGSRWMSSIMVNKRPKYLGTFATKEEASAAYMTAKRLLHDGCTI